jgi:hypothetical protein
MMSDLANGNRGVSVLAKPRRHAWRNRFGVVLQGISSSKDRAIARATIATRQKSVTGGSAGWCLNVMTMEGDSACGECINVRRPDILGSEAFEFRSKIVDANEQYIWLLVSY